MTAGGATPVGNGRGRSSYLSGVKIRDLVSFRVSEGFWATEHLSGIFLGIFLKDTNILHNNYSNDRF